MLLVLLSLFQLLSYSFSYGALQFICSRNILAMKLTLSVNKCLLNGISSATNLNLTQNIWKEKTVKEFQVKKNI